MSSYDLLWAEARKLPAETPDDVLRAKAQAIAEARAGAEAPSISPTLSRIAILTEQELAALKADLAAKPTPAPTPAPEKASK